MAKQKTRPSVPRRSSSEADLPQYTVEDLLLKITKAGSFASGFEKAGGIRQEEFNPGLLSCSCSVLLLNRSKSGSNLLDF